MTFACPECKDNYQDEIIVEINGREVRRWTYADQFEKRVKMRMAQEFAEGWYQRDLITARGPDAGNKASAECGGGGMSEAPKRIYAAAKRWAKGHGPDIDWRSGEWGIKTRMAVSQEYVRADIADDMMDALEEAVWDYNGPDQDPPQWVSSALAAIARAKGGDA